MLEPQRTQYALEAIEHNGRSLAGLIDDLLDASRMIAGKVRLNLQPVEVGAVVERAVESVRAVGVEKDIVLTTEIGSGEACVSADPKRLEQIVWNLVANAVDEAKLLAAISRLAAVPPSPGAA